MYESLFILPDSTSFRKMKLQINIKHNVLCAAALIFIHCNLTGSSIETSFYPTSKPWDTATKLTYQISAGGVVFTPNNSSTVPVYPSGYSFDFIQNNTKFHTIMHNSQGFILRNGVRLDLKNNPISPVLDIAYALGNFNMLAYDGSGNQISHSWFRKINLFTAGAGLDFGGKYINCGLQYRFGYCGGGYNKETLPFETTILNNQKLNLASNIYHGLDLSLGAQYKNFHFKFRRTYPLTQPIHVSSGYFCGLFSSSIEIGYSFH